MKEILKLTPQAIGSLMLAVQKGAMACMLQRPPEECDVTTMLLDFELENTPEGLIVMNPPTISFDELEDVEEVEE